jgi:hypothetical protein
MVSMSHSTKVPRSYGPKVQWSNGPKVQYYHCPIVLKSYGLKVPWSKHPHGPNTPMVLKLILSQSHMVLKTNGPKVTNHPWSQSTMFPMEPYVAIGDHMRPKEVKERLV